MSTVRLNTVELSSPQLPERAGRTDAQPFSEALARAVSSVDALQGTADAEAQKVAMGSGNLHEAALALEKADIAMRVLTKARNKLVEAYQEVMRMST